MQRCTAHCSGRVSQAWTVSLQEPGVVLVQAHTPVSSSGFMHVVSTHPLVSCHAVMFCKRPLTICSSACWCAAAACNAGVLAGFAHAHILADICSCMTKPGRFHALLHDHYQQGKPHRERVHMKSAQRSVCWDKAYHTASKGCQWQRIERCAANDISSSKHSQQLQQFQQASIVSRGQHRCQEDTSVSCRAS